jgi:Fe-S cluster biogenesis protein NfuA
MEEKIIEVLKNKVDPVLASHYGGSVLTGIEDGVAYVRLTGECATCPAATDTIESVVKSALLSEVEGLEDVQLDMSVSDDMLDMARKIMNHEI